MPITLNHSNIGVQYSSDKSYIIETVKSDLYRRNETIDTIVRDNIQVAPVTPSIYIENGTNNVYAVESYTYSGTANTADFTRVFTKSTTCDILIVGGGGGGGKRHGSGGGAGTLMYHKNIILNGTYNIKVGKGGVGAISASVANSASDGNFSQFVKSDGTQNYYAVGGGRGTTGGDTYANTNGGQGYLYDANLTLSSGNIFNGVAVAVSNKEYVNTLTLPEGCRGRIGGTQINNFKGGGGGGAGGVGMNHAEETTINDGYGGLGLAIDITGTSVVYAGGGNGADFNGTVLQVFDPSYSTIQSRGGGGYGSDTGTAQNGLDGTGGGGGGQGNDTSGNPGGNGGSGIVIIRYLLGTIPATNYLTNEPVVIAPTFTESIRTFIHSGGTEAQTTHTITVGRNTICDILIVGGGGGGGGGHGGGGGAGQLILMHQAILSGTYTIKVGKGGVRGTNPASGGIEPTKGSNSSFDTVIAEGGGANGGTLLKDGGSGAGGDSWLNGLGTIQKGLKNTSIDTYSSGTIYSKGNDGGIGGTDPGQGAGGGGAGTSGGDGKASYTNGGPGNGGDGLSGISELGYDFKTNFGNYGKLESDGNYWFAGGGGGGGWDQAITAVGGKGGGGNGGTGVSGGAVNGSNAVSNTGSGGGGGSANYGEGGNGGSGIVIIRFKSIANVGILDGITHKRLNLSFDSLGFCFDATKYIEYQTQLKTGVGGWRIVRYLPPNTMNGRFLLEHLTKCFSQLLI
jgi:hypothetical protein